MQTPPVTKPHTLGVRAHRASFHLLSTTEEEEPQKEGGDPACSRERASDGSPLSPDILADSVPWGPRSCRCPGGQIPPKALLPPPTLTANPGAEELCAVPAGTLFSTQEACSHPPSQDITRMTQVPRRGKPSEQENYISKEIIVAILKIPFQIFPKMS